MTLGTGSTMTSPVLAIIPESCLQDEKVIIRVFRLNPDSCYSITSHLEDSSKKKFFSYAHFIADQHGVIDTSQNESFGGHYKGVFQMGLIAALQPEPSEPSLRFLKKDVGNPNKIEIRVYDQFKTPEEIFRSPKSHIANSFHYRHFMAPGVTRFSIRYRKVRATLFVPPGEGPFPGVVDMFGTAGGLLEYRSAQLASRGIVSLALALFDFEDLPKFIFQYDLDYFREAVQILLSHDKVMKSHVGVIGVSKAGDLALSMATFIPQVKLAVAINGCVSNLVAPLKIREGHVIPYLLQEISRGQILDNNKFVNRDTYDDPEDYPETIIPIHESNAKYLFIVGEDDLGLPSMHHSSVAVDLMRNANKEQNIKVCLYKGAGHLIEPPYSPLCFSSYHNAFTSNIVWGGELKGHTEAQEKVWIEIINFINSNLKMQPSKL